MNSELVALGLDTLSWLFILGGSIFCMIGGIGILRMPDFYTRGHAAGLTDTLGAGLILIGLMFQAGLTLVVVKLAMVFFFLYVTSPTATHALFKSAYAGGVRWDGSAEAHEERASKEGDRDDSN
ncbi:MAG: monovalent cation/H(+) antiporter subunit G [Myxococcales bacterium]